ncbi:MAG: hypothetical protein M1114_05575 [Candidatus Dependentiae bacterium]|nr:hypothetical protein [Candidatus Dependentiae bacterium]
MNALHTDHRYSNVSDQTIAEFGAQLLPEIMRISQAQNSGYDTDYAFINVINDSALINEVKDLVDAKKKLRPTILLVIGIGGSNLGTLAIQQALYGVLYNEYQPDIKIYYLDTIDSDYTNDILLLTQQALEKDETVLLNVISKSGTTTETIVNFEIFLDLFKSYYEDEYKHYIIVTTDHGSTLWQLAQEEQFATLTIPKKLGGRYSVFSAVGLFPLKMIGVDIDQLISGAQAAIPSSLNTDILKNSAALSAAHIFAHYQEQIAIHNFFIFSVDLQGIGAWYRQLMGESIGKSELRSGEKAPVGILPTTSIGSTDLHSMVQFYLAGPNNSYTTFLSVETNKSALIVPKQDRFETIVQNIQNKQLSKIMSAILQGVFQAYQEKNRPFSTSILQEKSAYCIGQLLQLKMFEIVYLAFLLEISPFDQNEVELYKKATRKILAHE